MPTPLLPFLLLLACGQEEAPVAPTVAAAVEAPLFAAHPGLAPLFSSEAAANLDSSQKQAVAALGNENHSRMLEAATAYDRAASDLLASLVTDGGRGVGTPDPARVDALVDAEAAWLAAQWGVLPGFVDAVGPTNRTLLLASTTSPSPLLVLLRSWLGGHLALLDAIAQDAGPKEAPASDSLIREDTERVRDLVTVAEDVARRAAALPMESGTGDALAPLLAELETASRVSMKRRLEIGFRYLASLPSGRRVRTLLRGPVSWYLGLTAEAGPFALQYMGVQVGRPGGKPGPGVRSARGAPVPPGGAPPPTNAPPSP